MNVFIFSDKDILELPSAPVHISLTNQQFDDLIADCSNAENVYVLSLRKLIEDLVSYAANQPEENKEQMAVLLINLASPFIYVPANIKAYGILPTTTFGTPGRLYSKTFYIRSNDENSFIDGLTPEDVDTFNTVVRQFNKVYEEDTNIVLDLFVQGDKLYEIGI